MIIAGLFIGLIFIGIGFLVRWKPDMMLGYYSVRPKEKKKNIDLEGLSAFTKKGCIIIGITVIVSSCVLKFIHLEEYIRLILFFVTFIGIMIIYLKGQKYDYNDAKEKNNLKNQIYISFGLIGIIFLLINGVMFFQSITPTKIVIENESVRFTGSYGFRLNIADIESVELVDKIPAIKIRTNGVFMGYVNKGRFKVESWGECRLLMHSKKSPFLIITKNDGEKYIINYYKPSETENTYQQIESLITEQNKQ